MTDNLFFLTVKYKAYNTSFEQNICGHIELSHRSNLIFIKDFV